MSIIRYAILGFGGIAENRIAKEGFALDRKRFTPLAGIDLVGATDISAARREAVERLGLRWYESPEAVLEDREIQAVFIASNNLTHYPLAKKALESGRHVILEKPMATTLAHAQELVELAGKNSLSLAVDHMMLHNAFNQKARDLIAEGALGEVNDITLHMEFFYGSTPGEAAAWRCAKPDELGGPVGDVASHCFYMAEFLLGTSVRSVAAVYTPRTLNIRAENGAFIRFRLENGIGGSIRVSFNDPRGNLEGTLLNLGYEVYGTKKCLRAYGTLFQLSGHEGEPVKIRIGMEGAAPCEAVPVDNVRNIYQQVILEHAESIRTKKSQTGEEGVHNLRLILAAHESAQRGGKETMIDKRRRP